MQNWYQIFPRNTGLSIYVWIIFCVLPFYFVFKSSALNETIIGILMILLFFISYRMSFVSTGWIVYLSVSMEMAISIIMILFFGYVYFSLFLAFFIGNIKNLVRFIVLYTIHLITTVAAVSAGFFIKTDMFNTQFPFILISVIGVILIPFTMYNRNKREKLEGQLKDANKKLSQMVILEERQRIARDLHDTLGQKLSLIGLKSDLAKKLIDKKPELAKQEVNDINQTARTALKEVREMVADMRGIRLEDEIIHVKQLIKAAEMDFDFAGLPKLKNTPLLVEHVLSMCLKEAVTNVVKHSNASSCRISICQTADEVKIEVKDNGIGISDRSQSVGGHGLHGVRERLEFVNGSLEIVSSNGTTLIIRVPNVIKQPNKEELV